MLALGTTKLRECECLRYGRYSRCTASMDLANGIELQVGRQLLRDVLRGQEELHRGRGEKLLLHLSLLSQVRLLAMMTMHKLMRHGNATYHGRTYLRRPSHRSTQRQLQQLLQKCDAAPARRPIYEPSNPVQDLGRLDLVKKV